MAFSKKLNKRIAVDQPVQSKDPSGGNVTNWTELVSVKAGVKNLSGSERSATRHGGEIAEARTEFTIRYRPGLTAAMRVRYAGAAYNIRHVNNFNEANRWIILTCDTGVTP